jgi:hypothetical protein
MVGFTGSRTLTPAYAALVAAVVAHYAAAGQPLAVGCAAGADNFVRQVAPHAQVFQAAAYAGPPVARLARRSAAMVRAVQQSPAGLLVGFAGSPCPPACRPRSSFQGHGSGTWGTLALAVGVGLPVVLFWCQPGPAALPAGWGSWSPVFVAGLLAWQLGPAGQQPSLI